MNLPLENIQGLISSLPDMFEIPGEQISKKFNDLKTLLGRLMTQNTLSKED